MSVCVSHLANHAVVLADSDFSIPPELCVDVGQQVTIKAIAGCVVSAAVGSIDGDISFVLYEGESIQCVFDGANWHVI